jgi:hypothetical protein
MRPIHEYSTYVFALDQNIEVSIKSRKSRWLLGRSLYINKAEMKQIISIIDSLNKNAAQVFRDIIQKSGEWIEIPLNKHQELLGTLTKIIESIYKIDIFIMNDQIQPETPTLSHKLYKILFQNIYDFFNQMKIENKYYITCFMSK